MTRKNDPGVTISDAVEDQYGRRYFRFGTDERHIWLPFATAALLERKTIARLSCVGIQIATNKSKEAFKRDIEGHADYRFVSIANEPGWFDDVYVLRDGRVCAEPSVEHPVVVFEPDERFAASSSVKDWQSAIAPLVGSQPLALFALALSFVGPLMRFAPPDLHNLFVEIVGAPHVGKSTLAKLMSSVWGGGGDRLGICQSWAYSPAELDPIRSEFRDGLLVLDEALKAGKTASARAEKIGDAVIAVSDSSARRVFHADPVQQIRQAVLSTSNMPMRDLVGSASDTQNAILSRVLTVQCSHSFGILDTMPAGFNTAKDAVEALDLAVTTHYGSAATAFLNRLLRWPDDKIRRGIQVGIKRAASRGLCGADLGPRTTKTLGMIYAAGLIAQRLKVIPEDWGSMDDALRAAVLDTTRERAAPQQAPLDRVNAFIRANRHTIIDVTDSRLPVTGEVFDTMPGVLLEGHQLLVIPTKFFREQMADATEILEGLDALGRLKRDADKFSKKAPRAITSGRRAYYVNLSEHI